MEAKDLMIGDWVYSRQGVPSRVTSITCDGIIETEDGVSNIEIAEPIPITPKILKKNGFSPETYDDQILVLNEKSGEVIYYGCGQDFGLTIDNQYSQIRELKIQYLHELQHTLRLCKIDKEIEL